MNKHFLPSPFLNNHNLIFLKVNSLSHICFCPKRSKIESFYKLPESKDTTKKHSISTGTRLHREYSYPYRSFDRVLLRGLLRNKADKYGVFQKQIDNIVIRGKYDDLRIVLYNNKKYASLIELKTTTKRYIWSREIKAAIKQLELYQWLLRELLEQLRYPLWERSYLEIYSQNSGDLIKRIAVPYNNNIEEWIRVSVKVLQGLVKMDIPPFSYCKLCPQVVRERCNWYQLRLEYERMMRGR